MAGGLMVLGMVQAQAQTNGTTLSMQTLNIALTGFAGGGDTNSTAVPEKIDTKKVISSLLGSNSPKSKLQFTIDNGSGSPAFFVTTGSGKNISAIDVTPFFNFATLVGPISKGKTSYTIDSFSFGGSDTNGAALTTVSFTVQGLTTSQSSGQFNSQVNGFGTDNGATAVLKGSITATPAKNTTVSISDGGDSGSSTNAP